MYDCIIVGSGPAGLSTAINLALNHRDFLWFGSAGMSDKLRKAHRIDNYPGFFGVSGESLLTAFEEHRRRMEIPLTGKLVTSIMPAQDYYMVLADNEVYETRALALCTGVVNQKQLPGEEEFLGRGVSYCATCDGNFYKGKKLAVCAASPRFEHEVAFLADLAEEVAFFPAYPSPQIARDNVRISTDYPVEIWGGMKACGIELKSGKRQEVDGVFLLRDAIAPSALLHNLKTADGHIRVNRRQETNLPGCFAAGDCTGRPYQYAKAVGEGNVAAHSILEYLAAQEKAGEAVD